MTRVLRLIAICLVLAGCGSDTLETGDATDGTRPPTIDEAPATSTSAEPATTSTEPDVDQLAQLRAARARWAEAAPGDYVFEYFLGCECDGGPFRVEVDASGEAIVFHIGDGPTDSAYTSIEEIFDDIEQAIVEGEVPVEVEYDDELGYPRLYVWNGPALAYDGGFTLEITYFMATPAEALASDELEAARATWRDLILADYDYTFRRQCFCTEEFRGPYEVEVRGGEVVSATFRGADILEIELLRLDSYDELILTVEDLFDEIDRSIGEVAELTVAYDAELGHPTSIFIDIDRRMADEEIGYVIENLRPASTN